MNETKIGRYRRQNERIAERNVRTDPKSSRPQGVTPVVFIRPEDRSDAEQWVCDLASETGREVELAIASGRDAHLEPIIANYRNRRREGAPCPKVTTHVAAVFNTRLANTLEENGIVHLGDLIGQTETDLLSITQIDRASIHAINDVLARIVLRIEVLPESADSPAE